MTYMIVIKKILFVLLCIVVFIGCSEESKKTKRPNVIIVVTDDQGFGDLGYYGNPHVQTPTLDSFAKESVRFDQFIVSPVCAPTRASLMTGRYSLRTGVRDTYRGGAIMATEETTLAEMLKEAGYTTGMVGKWHLGDNYPSRPQDQGFDYTLRHLSGGIGQPGDWPNTPKGNRSYFDPILWKNGEMFQSKGYCSDVFTDAAIDFVEVNKEQPFFLYLSYNAPHAPLQVPQEYYDRYKDLDPSSGFENDARPFPEMDERMKENARKVYAMVSNIDDNLKKLFQQLKELKLEDNTLVIFMTDNGHQHDRYAAGMRGRKSFVYEGGVRVPCFWRLPSKFKGNRDIKTPAAHYDIFPTLADLCNTQLPTDSVIDGKSLVPLLSNENSSLDNRTLVRSWVRGGPERYDNISIRKDHYKLVGNTGETEGIEQFELFNIQDDPYERNNIVGTNTLKAQELKNEMDTWFDEMTNSPNFIKAQPAIVGTVHENPSVLNLNDAVFEKNETVGQDIAGWEIEATEAGNYDIQINLGHNRFSQIALTLTVGELEIKRNSNELVDGIIDIKNIALQKGATKLVPIITGKNGGYIKPFYVVMTKIN
ncbi:arylsulfatase [Arenibacter sp. ARW7G5Y1]|uniref:arylsulfatase n=1 Tax=Arenibacter sp. ARW7G5Y1 TaxID=2135619 RepID=UPI000D75226E|nr:arylsulfatase [Arenibacter sp. ARW7G5Y1]PXX25415.1 arylsulfatase [Arenibacter sp. ARW7G5Y1]